MTRVKLAYNSNKQLDLMVIRMYLTVPQTEGISRQAKELPNFKTMNTISTSGKFSRAPGH
jgi:hypothetical protein